MRSGVVGRGARLPPYGELDVDMPVEYQRVFAIYQKCGVVSA